MSRDHSSTCGKWQNGVCTCKQPDDPEVILYGFAPARAPGIKLDSGKPKLNKHFRMEFPEAMKAVARHAERTVSDPGHVLYGWKSVENGFHRYTEALDRHLTDSPNPCFPDYSDAAVEAATAVAWNAMARLEILLQSRRTESTATGNSGGAEGVI